MREESQGKGVRENALTPEAIEKLTKAKMLIQSSLGQIVLAMAAVARYKHQTLADLSHLVIDPLVRDRIAIAHTKPSNDEEGILISPPAIAIWASVSEEISAKLEDQSKAGVFPVRLKPADWNSGDIVWLLDVIAPTQQMATAVLASFNKVAKQDQIRIHPVVSRLVDREVLQKLSGANKEPEAATAEGSETLN